METLEKKDDVLIENESTLNAKIQRRSFLRFAGAGAAAVGVLAACTKHDDTPAVIAPTTPGTIDLGSGDAGILNYAYALEQLEAAFYIKVVSSTSFATLFTATEQSYLTDIRDHEISHRELFKAAIPAAVRISDALVPDFSTINFNDRTSILTSAKAFEDTGVSAYNGAGQYITNTANGVVYLGLAGKIVSVEARHASLIGDLINPGSFATTLDANGLDSISTATTVLAIANTYLTTKVSGNNLPNK